MSLNRIIFPIESSSLRRGRKSNGSLSPNRPDKEYPPHVPRDYQIKNSKILSLLDHCNELIGKKLEDMKMNTFKEILNSFEAGDYQAF